MDRGRPDDGVDLAVAVHLAVARVQTRARPAQRAPAALVVGLHLGQVVDREEVRLADLDHRREAVRLQVVVAVLVPGQQAEGDAVVRVALLAAAPARGRTRWRPSRSRPRRTRAG